MRKESLLLWSPNLRSCIEMLGTRKISRGILRIRIISSKDLSVSSSVTEMNQILSGIFSTDFITVSVKELSNLMTLKKRSCRPQPSTCRISTS